MTKTVINRIVQLIALLFLVLSNNPANANQQPELVVFAAASLTDAYEEIATAFEAANPGVEVLFNFGGSSTLAAQLVRGAPADIFASANLQQMVNALEGQRIGRLPRIFAQNQLVVITPADNPANIQTLADLANPDVSLILAAPDVPVRAYTDTVLQRMANAPEYGTDYPQALLANVVSEELNVRRVTAKIALGEADAGFVYTSDVTPDIAERVRLFTIPDEFNIRAAYPIAITDDTHNLEIAQQFVRFVLSDAGQDILVRWGFMPAPECWLLCAFTTS